MSLTKPRHTRPSQEHQCESLACAASVPASVCCACLGAGCLSASRVCLALGVCSLSCLLGYLPARCEATQACSTMFTLGYSCCCACGARAVCSCAFGCSPQFSAHRQRTPQDSTDDTDTRTRTHPYAHAPARRANSLKHTPTQTPTLTHPLAHAQTYTVIFTIFRTKFLCFLKFMIIIIKIIICMANF